MGELQPLCVYIVIYETIVVRADVVLRLTVVGYFSLSPCYPLHVDLMTILCKFRFYNDHDVFRN